MVVDGLNVVSSGELVKQRRAARAGGHGFVLGCVGAGKTRQVMEQIQSILQNSEDFVVVLDNDGSYRTFAEALGFHAVSLEDGTDVFLNPLDVDMVRVDSEDVFLDLKIEFVRDLFGVLLGQELTPGQAYLLEGLVKQVYAPFCESVDVMTGAYNKALLPTLTSLYELLCGTDDVDAKLMAEALWPLVKGCCTMFSGQSDVLTNQRLVVFDFMRCPHNVLHAAEMVVLEYVRSHESFGGGVKRTSEQKLWVYVDDLYPLLRDEICLDFLLSFCKSVPFYGCIFTGVTQNVDGFFHWDASRELLLNAGYVHLLKLSKTDEDKLRELGLHR